MGTQYVVMNGAMTTTAPITPVTTSATLYTALQIVPSANTPVDIVKWWVSFDGSALATPFPCDLVETGSIAATVTAYAAADVMPFSDYGVAANSAGSTGVPLNLGTAYSGYTSSAEGSITANRVFDVQQVDPVTGYQYEFSLGARPRIKAGNVCRIRVKGDGTRKVVAGLIFEV